jgi:hypothetical protein
VRQRTLLVAALAALVVAACAAPRQRTAEERAAAARELFAGINVTVTVDGSSLGAARTMADFGVGQDLRMVAVRIVEDLSITVRLEATSDVVLAGPPRLCLTGPFWNPLDAGLSDRCWGDPDLATVAAERFERDGAGHVVLRAGMPIVIEASLERGDERCDYAPGDWLLEVDAEPVVDDIAGTRLDITKAPLSVPFAGDDPLTLRPTSDTRFCSYGAAVYTRQGDPPLREP